jgi:hypothetical protein
MLFFWIITALQFFLIKRYKIIGTVYFRQEKLELKLNNGEGLIFTPKEGLKLFIKINGYRGESTQVLFLTFSEGLGRLEINDGENNLKYDILAENCFYENLIKILNVYKHAGVYFDIRKK